MNKKYAMILKNTVIDIVESEIGPQYPPDVEGNEVSAIDITNYDGVVVLGMEYNPETKLFSERIYTKSLMSEITEQDLINADFLLNQAEQSAKLNEINETLAVLLINQSGGM